MKEIVDMIEAEANAYAESFRLIPQTQGWFDEKKSDYIAGRSKSIEEDKKKDERIKAVEAELAVTKESIKNLFSQIEKFEPHFNYIISQWDEYINLSNNF